MTEWFYGTGGQQYGPIDEGTLRARLATGEVKPGDLVWREGLPSWLPYREAVLLEPDQGFGNDPKVEDQAAPQEKWDSPYAPPASSLLDGRGESSVPELPPASGWALGSLVLGLFSLILLPLGSGLFLGIPAVVLGRMAVRNIDSAETFKRGRRLAIAGTIFGGCALFLFVVGVLI